MAFIPWALNMTAKEAEENRGMCVDLVRQTPANTISSIRALGEETTIDGWIYSPLARSELKMYSMARDLNWRVFFELYDVQHKNFEELLAFKGVGPATARALGLVSQLTYGRPVSWRDPVKFSFAHGGKDGAPFPVDRKAMDGSVKFLREMLDAAELERSLKKGLSKGWLIFR